MGTATTNLAAAKWGRHSIGVEVDPKYFKDAHDRINRYAEEFFHKISVETVQLEKTSA
jgi:DNA modification methylase